MNCPNCGGTVPPGVNRCIKCGSYIEQPSAPPSAGPSPPPAQTPFSQPAPPIGPPKSKVAAGLLGIFLGGLGVHRFYLGDNTIGGTMLGLQIAGLLTIMLCGFGLLLSIPVAIWGLVEGFLILFGVINKDASGRPLT